MKLIFNYPTNENALSFKHYTMKQPLQCSCLCFSAKKYIQSCNRSNFYDRIRLAIVVFNRLQQRLKEAGLDVKGKLSSWMEGGADHAGLIKGLSLLIDKMQSITLELPDVASSPRDKLIEVGCLEKPFFFKFQA